MHLRDAVTAAYIHICIAPTFQNIFQTMSLMHKFNAHAGVLASHAPKHYTVFYPQSCASCKIQERLPAKHGSKGSSSATSIHFLGQKIKLLSQLTPQPLWCIMPVLRRGSLQIWDKPYCTEEWRNKRKERSDHLNKKVPCFNETRKLAVSQLSKHARAMQTWFLRTLLAILQFTT